MRQDDIFLHCITIAEVGRLKAEHGKARKQFTFQTPTKQVINTKERFFEAANASLPLDPPNVLHDWDALQDSLFGGLLRSGARFVDIVWPFANDVAIVFLVKAVKFFKLVADSVGGRDDIGASVTVRVFLVCSNEASRNKLEAEFWFLR